MTETFTITAAFTPSTNPNIPPDPSLIGSFTITFDPTVFVTNATAGLTVNSLLPADLNIPAGYDVFSSQGRTDLIIGGLAANVRGISIGTNDYGVCHR